MRVRLYKEDAQKGQEVTLSKEQLRHLNVLRLRTGEPLRVFDGKGHEYEGVYTEKVRDGTLLLEREIPPQEEPKTAITLAIAVPKGSRMDFLTEKVSELGVQTIIPLLCARSVVKPGTQKIERWRRITIEACAQSGRATLPRVEDPLPFGALMEKVSNYNQAFLCQAGGEPLGSAYTGSASALVIVGPEGDFTEAELDGALRAGCQKVSLGPSILRTETAGIASVSQLVGLSQKVYK